MTYVTDADGCLSAVTNMNRRSASGAMNALAQDWLTMTTETTDPLEQAVIEAAEKFAEIWNADPMMLPEATERLRLHLKLALAKARLKGFDEAASMASAPIGRGMRRQYWTKEIAALEARLKEME